MDLEFASKFHQPSRHTMEMVAEFVEQNIATKFSSCYQKYQTGLIFLVALVEFGSKIKALFEQGFLKVVENTL